jgi:predicted ATPase/class 3 adenylate cyclase
VRGDVWSPRARASAPAESETRASISSSAAAVARLQELPTGTVTLLFTDIEGSTRLLEELGDRYSEVLGEHRRLLKDVFERHGGVEIDALGDAVYGAFSRASDALLAAGEAQRALTALPVRVRMGVHTGEPLLTDEGYVGIDVHRTARIAAAGHGGQVLLSETTRELLDGEFELRDLGEHRLKDLGSPIRLHQLGRDEFPPVRSLSQAHLPLEPVPLLGRKRELAELVRLIGADRARLVTVTGPGGIGKTSFAATAAADLVESFDGGATLIELAPIRSADLVLPAIAEGLGAEGDAAEHIADRELLLVLDNLEQVIAAAGDVARLSSACPNLSVLATSREPLRIAGEREFPLKPLAEAPAVELFRQRAEAVLPQFSADYDLLAEICRRLDSLPLAIELAAARVKVLPPKELLGRLDRRLPLLTASRRDLPERQQTLRATIAWSYDLCSTEEQQLFGRLGVFSGGFTLDAAEAVCDASLDSFQGLLEKSLIGREGERFSMLETIREFAVERLEESIEAEEVRRRHAEYFIAMAEGVETEHLGPTQAHLRERFRTEWDNIRAALSWAVELGQTEHGLRLAGALTVVWLDQNLAVEGERWFRDLFESSAPVDDAVRAKALITASMVAGVRGNISTAGERGEEALAIFRALGSEEGIAGALTGLAVGPIELGRPEEAGRMLEEAEALHRKAGNSGGIRRVLHVRGLQAAAAGDLNEGRRLFREAAELSRQENDTFSAASALHSLGDVELDAGEIDAAEAAYRDGLQLAWGTNADRLVCYTLTGLAAVAAERGEDERAALLWGFAEAYEERLRFTLRWRSLYEQRLEPVAAAHPEQYETGRRLGVDSAVEIAFSGG